MYTSVLFDLDGTLTDSKEGIIKSVEYALIQMGETTEGRLDQHIIVGPPLVTTFRETFGFSEEKALETYAHFQQRYSTSTVSSPCCSVCRNGAYAPLSLRPSRKFTPGLSAKNSASRRTSK